MDFPASSFEDVGEMRGIDPSDLRDDFIVRAGDEFVLLRVASVIGERPHEKPRLFLGPQERWFDHGVCRKYGKHQRRGGKDPAKQVLAIRVILLTLLVVFLVDGLENRRRLWVRLWRGRFFDESCAVFLRFFRVVVLRLALSVPAVQLRAFFVGRALRGASRRRSPD
jgi:hypothetical protein